MLSIQPLCVPKSRHIACFRGVAVKPVHRATHISGEAAVGVNFLQSHNQSVRKSPGIFPVDRCAFLAVCDFRKLVAAEIPVAA